MNLSQIPDRHAARYAPARVRDADGEFIVVTQLLDAESHAQRAAILLRTSDDIVLRRADVLQHACAVVSFPVGAQYLDCRVAALAATRDRQGMVPERIALTLEIWRRGLVAVAEGMRL